jgi:hypothetical protein
MAMSNSVEPLLHPVAIKDLRPTQMTVGTREVERKRLDWRQHHKHGADFLGQHMIPAVIGPGNVPWVIDHHHLVRALHEEGIKDVLITVIARLNDLPKRLFLSFLDNHNWLHPYDANGRRCEWKDLPKRVADLADDPYRSLAGEVRRAGGFAKTATPYSEFLWADFFRKRINPKHINDRFEVALIKAIDCARSHEASYLPGFSGPEKGTTSREEND